MTIRTAQHVAPGTARGTRLTRRRDRTSLRHALSIDVEDWYHDSGETPAGQQDNRVVDNTLRLLDILAAHRIHATFFFLGEVAERFRGLVRRAADAGHEIASHGYHHRPLRDLLQSEFRRDVARSLRLLEDVSGQPVRGYRAPYLSIKAGVHWPIDTLRELGLAYDSSILPIDRPPGLELVCPRTPFRHENGLWEIPVAVLQFGHFWYLPLASGSGLRLLPLWLLCRWVRRFERDVGSGVFYLHPWELDPGSPTAERPGRWLLRPGRRHLSKRLGRLLGEVAFGPIADVFADRVTNTESVAGAKRARST
jgi:polysaccharide deacetylase family protein (PEP-CTERM system associated)